jgi:hypothetical protein
VSTKEQGYFELGCPENTSRNGIGWSLSTNPFIMFYLAKYRNKTTGPGEQFDNRPAGRPAK